MTQSADVNVGKGNPFKGFAKQMGKAFSKVFSGEKALLGQDVHNIEVTPNTISALGAEMISGVHDNHKDVTHEHHSSPYVKIEQSHHTDHNSDHQDQHTSHGAHGQYQMSPYFEKAVEIINTAAGIIVMASVILAGINLILVAINANFGKSSIYYRSCQNFTN